jgi:hypothetical protein
MRALVMEETEANFRVVERALGDRCRPTCADLALGLGLNTSVVCPTEAKLGHPT